MNNQAKDESNKIIKLDRYKIDKAFKNLLLNGSEEYYKLLAKQPASEDIFTKKIDSNDVAAICAADRLFKELNDRCGKQFAEENRRNWEKLKELAQVSVYSDERCGEAK